MNTWGAIANVVDTDRPISIKNVLEPYRKENMDEIRKIDLSLSEGKEG